MKYSPVFLFITLFLFFAINCFSQQHQQDSIQKLLSQYNDEDEKHLQLLNALSLAQVNVKPDDAIITADKAIALSQKLKNQKGLAAAYNNKGFIMMRKSSYDESKDFLKKALAINITLKNENGKADNYCIIGEITRRQGETDSAKTYFEKALTIYTQTQNKKGMADANYYLGLAYRDLGNEKPAMTINDHAIIFYEQTANECGLALSINALGAYYYRISDYKNALMWMNKSKAINERIGNLYGLAIDLGNMANIYNELPDYSKELDCLLKELRIEEQLNSPYTEAFCYSKISECYLHLNQYERAIEYAQKAIGISEQIKSTTFVVPCLIQIGSSYLQLENSDNALEYISKAFNLAVKKNNVADIALSSRYLGNAYLKKNNAAQAIFYYQKAFELDSIANWKYGMALELISLAKAITIANNAELIKAGFIPSERNIKTIDYFQDAIQIGKEINSLEVQRDALQAFSLLFENQNDFNKSFQYYKQYVAIKDSMINTDNSKSIANLQMQYNSEKQEQQIVLLNKDKQIKQTEIQKQKAQRNAVMGGFALVLLLVAVIFNRYYVKQKANKKIEQTLAHLKNTQEQLVQQGKLTALGKMTADVAAQIKNPIITVKNSSLQGEQLVRDYETATTEEQRNAILDKLKINLEGINTNGKAADKIVKDVLIQSRK